MELLLLGEALAAQEAMTYGLVNRVVAHGEARAEAVGMARKIASKSKAIVAIGKAAFYRQADMPLGEAYAFASEVMVQNMMKLDAAEGICAFIEKRPPDWKDA
jgi:enoyl-CoA hydratase/carnithine racemase